VTSWSHPIPHLVSSLMEFDSLELELLVDGLLLRSRMELLIESSTCRGIVISLGSKGMNLV
jgi:hypothetical protein